MTGPKRPVKSLEALFEEMPDPRVERGKEHDLGEILLVAVCTALVGGEGAYDMADLGEARVEWLRSLGLQGTCPGHDTFTRVFQALDPVAFAEAFAMWTQGLGERLGREVVALDGKAARRAVEAGRSPRHRVSAWAAESGLVLGQLQVPEKSNETAAVPALLRQLELAGCIVTADALHCQKSIAKEIIEADADYVLALKGNQGTTHDEIRAFLDDAILRKARGLATHRTVEKGHGRIETRTYWQSEDIAWFADRAEWTGLRSVGVVEATREIGNKASTERRYYLTSLPADAALFAKAVRGHWAIENQCHWVLDVVFQEDQSRARSGNASANLGLLRRLALNLIKTDTSFNRGIHRKQLLAAINPDHLTKLLGF